MRKLPETLVVSGDWKTIRSAQLHFHLGKFVIHCQVVEIEICSIFVWIFKGKLSAKWQFQLAKLRDNLAGLKASGFMASTVQLILLQNHWTRNRNYFKHQCNTPLPATHNPISKWTLSNFQFPIQIKIFSILRSLISYLVSKEP